MKKILLLGSGELGKELTISLKRMGCYVITCDAYENAPAMQVSDQSEVFNNLYFVGAGTHPGAGMPGVLSSAKVLDKLF